MRTCKDCRWWKETTEGYEEKKIGFCHKLPPMPHPKFHIGVFPRVIESCWCGEFEAADGETLRERIKGEEK